MKLIKVLLSGIFFSLLIASCEQEDINAPFESTWEIVSLDEDQELSDLMGKFNKNTQGRSTSFNFTNTEIGELRMDEILKTHVDPERPGAHYSIPIASTDRRIKEWLILEPTTDGYVGYIMHFESANESAVNLKNLHGYIQFFDLNRNLQASTFFENGEQVSVSENTARTETTVAGLELPACCECKAVDVTYTHTGSSDNDGNFGTFTVNEYFCDCGDPCTGGGETSGGGETTGGETGGSGIGTPIDGGTGPTGGGPSGGSGGTLGLGEDTCEGNGGFSGSDGNCLSEEEYTYEILTDDSFLTDQQSNRLKEAFKQVYSIPINAKFLRELLNSGYKVKITINPNLSTPGGFSPSTNTISFRSFDDINYNVVLEEYFHAFQHYRIGIGKYNNEGNANIEFEAKLYQDIVSRRHLEQLAEMGLSFYYLGHSSSEYADWLIEITSNHTTYPAWSTIEDKYYDFIELFIQEKTVYASPIDYELEPTTMLYLFGQ